MLRRRVCCLMRLDISTWPEFLSIKAIRVCTVSVGLEPHYNVVVARVLAFR